MGLEPLTNLEKLRREVQCSVTSSFHFRALGVRSSRVYSKMRIAAAITVVQRPCLSPTADCVIFAVRTILFEMR
jgi:hypothetical protein